MLPTYGCISQAEAHGMCSPRFLRRPTWLQPQAAGSVPEAKALLELVPSVTGKMFLKLAGG